MSYTIADVLKFMHPELGSLGGVVEVMAAGCRGEQRGLWRGFCGGNKGILAGWYNDVKKLISAIRDLDKGWRGRSGEPEYPESIYFTVNQPPETLLGRSNNQLTAGAARTRDIDIEQYTNLFIDIDVDLPAGISSTDPEHDAAIAMADTTRTRIRNTFFWPEPMVCDSGNGAHLMYKAHFANTKENAALAKEFLSLLGKWQAPTNPELPLKFDTTVFTPGRLTKAYGTVVRKGDATETRPHRRSCALYIPEVTEDTPPVTLELLQQAVDYMRKVLGEEEVQDVPRAPAPAGSNHPRPDKADMFNSIDGVEPLRQGGSLRLDEYLRDNNIKVNTVKKGPGGCTMYILERCLFDPTHAGGEAAVCQSVEGMLFYQCFHESCTNDPERKWKQAREIISGDASLGQWMEGGSFGVEFPHVNKKGKPVGRVENFRALLKAYRVGLAYNLMTRKVEFKLTDGRFADSDRIANTALAFIEELCVRHGMPFTRMQSFIQLISEENAYHPVRDHIESAKWDGVTRLEALAQTVTVVPGYEDQWRVYLKRWLLQGIAALYQPDFSCRGVLVFTGEQNVGKTSWFRRLCSKVPSAFGEGKQLDPANKDSVMLVIQHWLVELGELDATFKKADISRLKAFTSQMKDELRTPYSRAPDVFKRQTIFGGTVNDQDYLVDPTGNSRWWTVDALEINFNHDINMQQVWAEVKILFDLKESWFLNPEEMRVLNELNRQHEIGDPLEDGMQKGFKFDSLKASWNNPMTAAEVLGVIGMRQPNRSQMTKAGAVLKRLAGRSVLKRVKGALGRYFDMPYRRDLFDGVDENKQAATVLPFNKEEI